MTRRPDPKILLFNTYARLQPEESYEDWLYPLYREFCEEKGLMSMPQNMVKYWAQWVERKCRDGE